MLTLDVHRQFIESWQNLAEDERKAVQRLLQLLEHGDRYHTRHASSQGWRFFKPIAKYGFARNSKHSGE
jgi:hypothetical protein